MMDILYDKSIVINTFSQDSYHSLPYNLYDIMKLYHCITFTILRNPSSSINTSIDDEGLRMISFLELCV